MRRKSKNVIKKCMIWLKNNYKTLLYVILLTILSAYIIINWNKCISMKFFDQFDGNNILFLIWIILLVLEFHDIESKDFKIHKNMQKDLLDAKDDFEQKKKNKNESNNNSKKNDEENNNEQAN